MKMHTSHQREKSPPAPPTIRALASHALFLALIAMMPTARATTPDSGLMDAISETVDALSGTNLGEPRNAGWRLSFDNDAFASGNDDRDYTGGISVALHGTRARDFPVSVDPALEWLDRKTGFRRFYRSRSAYAQTHAIQFGLLLFTPDDIQTERAIQDDRPYASLVYLSNAQSSLNPERTRLYQSTLTVGLLGTPVGEWIQKGVHNVSNGAEPMGYDNQISDGGEPTFRYGVARHSLLASGSVGRGSYDVKLGIEGAIGYLSEGSVAIGARWGRIRTPWWTSTSEYANYAPQASATGLRGFSGEPRGERYLWAGVRLRARAYNALLQGQFRDSAVTFSSSELRPVLMEAWLGVTAQFGKLRASYALRYQTREIKSGAGARDLMWAGFTLSRHIG